MDNLVEVLPNINGLTKSEYTKKEWLMFYKNVWVRNAMARAIDVATDKVLKAENPEQPVEAGDQIVSVKFRLETRKIALQDSLSILAGIDSLMAISDEEFDAKVLSKEALAVDADMIPKKDEETTKETPEGETSVTEVIPAVEEPAEVTKEEEISNEAKV